MFGSGFLKAMVLGFRYTPLRNPDIGDPEWSTPPSLPSFLIIFHVMIASSLSSMADPDRPSPTSNAPHYLLLLRCCCFQLSFGAAPRSFLTITFRLISRPY